MTLLMSAGMVQPGSTDPQKKLAALAETRACARRPRARAPRREASGPRDRPAAAQSVHPARISRIASSRSNR